MRGLLLSLFAAIMLLLPLGTVAQDHCGGDIKADSLRGDTLPAFRIAMIGDQVRYTGYVPVYGDAFITFSFRFDHQYGDSLAIYRIVNGQEVLQYRWVYTSTGFNFTQNWHMVANTNTTYEFVVRATGGWSKTYRFVIGQYHLILPWGITSHHSMSGQRINPSTLRQVIIEKSVLYQNGRKVFRME